MGETTDRSAFSPAELPPTEKSNGAIDDEDSYAFGLRVIEIFKPIRFLKPYRFCPVN